MRESETEIFFSDADILRIKKGVEMLFVPSVEVEGGWVKHVNCEGARFHVISWSTQGKHCSEPKCIINKPTG
jgi:hypothetical protein